MKELSALAEHAAYIEKNLYSENYLILVSFIKRLQAMYVDKSINKTRYKLKLREQFHDAPGLAASIFFQKWKKSAPEEISFFKLFSSFFHFNFF